MAKYLYVLCGHTAAGKTTLGKKICDKLKMELVSEGKIKREMVGESYTADNSLDETLRDRGYKKAIDISIEKLKDCNQILLDASFHKKFRRDWIKDAIDKSNLDIVTIWLYVYCPNKDKVIERIQERKVAKKEADNQADSIKIYEHIISTFDMLKKEDMWDNSLAYIFNTDIEMVEDRYEKNLTLADDKYIKKLERFVYSYFIGESE
jgi:predicted kinase